MRFPSEIAFGALHLAKYAKENDMSDPKSLAMYFPKATYDAAQALAPHSRRLQEDGTTSMRGSVSIPLTQGENSDLLSVFENPYFDKIKKCGFNFEEMGTTTMSQAMFPSTFSEEESMQNLYNAFGNDVNQPSCTQEQLLTAVKATQNFMSCTNLNSFVTKVALMENDFEKIENEIDSKCSPVTENLLSLGMGKMLSGMNDDEEDEENPDTPSMEEMNDCMGSIFGPRNVIGNFVRKLYLHPQLFCDCTKKYASLVPDCTVEEEGMTISLSMVKNSACVVGVGCEEYKEHCRVENAVLDSCLPELEADDFDCTEVMKTCAAQGSVFSIVPPIIATTIPDICTNDVTKDVTKRYNVFQERCKGKKDYFTNEFDEKIEEETVLGAPALSTSSKSSYAFKAPSSEEKDESSSSSHKFGLTAAFVLVVGTAFVVIKKKYYDSEDHFTPLSTGGFEYETAA
jgi:hypothetical protein